MLALTSKFLRQIVPPVIATLIAAVLIAGFNRAFMTHLTQPRLGMLNNEANTGEPALPRAAPAVAAAPAAAAELVTEPLIERAWEKGGAREAVKDQVRSAEAPPAPPPPAATRRPEQRAAEVRPAEPRPAEPRMAEPRMAEPYLAPAPAAAPVTSAPIVVAPPVVVAQPARQEPVFAPVASAPVLAEPPMVTVPDRARALPQAQLEQRGAPQGPIGAIVNTLKPSSLLARAREFGEKIEAAGNEILPSIRN